MANSWSSLARIRNEQVDVPVLSLDLSCDGLQRVFVRHIYRTVSATFIPST